MALSWCLTVCFLGITSGFTFSQETTTDKPLILNDPPEITPGIPEGNPPMFTLAEERAVPVLRKEDLGGFENVNPTHVDGKELFEMDIMLTEEQRNQLLERKAIIYTSSRWPNGVNGTPVVPYQFAASVDQTAVQAGLAHWEQHTCIVFQKITGTAPTNYLNFINGSGCWSYVGMLTSPQDISIGQGCSGLGTVAHEVGHAMGFHHEQSRSDRDDYVSILWENIEAGKEHNFVKETDNNYSIKYDFNSDMHYGSDYFTTNGKNTISTKNPLAQELIGSRNGLSHYDKLLANTMYPCISKWMQTCNIATNPCQNDGYVGKDCKCVCRSGTSGTNCETVTSSYYDSLISGCSTNITAPGTLTSPNYPSNYPANLKCVKWIQAPACNTVKIKFNAFRLYQRNPYCANSFNCCYFDRLEIRTTNLTVGDVYCDQEIAVGTEFTSPSNQIILYFKTASNYYPGWSINVTFVPTASCQPDTTTSSSASTSTSTSTSPPTSTSTSTSSSPSTSTSTSPPTSTSTSTSSSPSTSTSTSPPTSTSTSTSSSPSTSTSTSPPTSTSTSTSSSTSASTSTSTSPTTTTSPPNHDACGIKQLGPNKIQWTSPNFGLGKYPNNEPCTLSMSSNAPMWSLIKLNTFSLGLMDSVTFERPTLSPLVLKGSQSGPRSLPSANFLAEFANSLTKNGIGFNITVEQKSSNCHQLITATQVGDSGVIQAPVDPNYAWQTKACEFWIRSPPSTRIQLDFTLMNLDKCGVKSVFVNSEGDVSYPTSTTSSFCGSAIPPSMVSVANELNVLFFSKLANKRFKATWTVV